MKAVLYARYSPRKNAVGCESCETQIEVCQAWCNFKGLEVIGTFRDEALSGKKTDNRPGLQEALTLVKAEKAILVVHSLSRLARNTIRTLQLVEDLKSAKADFKSIKENIETSGPAGRMMLTLLAAFDQMERERISERTSEAMLRHQANGRRMSSRVPYGWQVDPTDSKRIIKNPIEQTMIVRAKHFRGLGFTLNEIITILDAEGYKPRKIKKHGKVIAGKWHTEKIRYILARQ